MTVSSNAITLLQKQAQTKFEVEGANPAHAAQETKVTIDVSGISKVIPGNQYILERLTQFGDLQSITLKASCFNCISISCKDEPVCDLANGIRGMMTASLLVHVQPIHNFTLPQGPMGVL
ncbi:hypothetical protein BKA70DRAFT_1424451 [Coprinopsis sp. MPI-PUGE-AT-0042]|nr:hypothetical protein BKA70DRAFT_1424451 [Coprinopsis sp. MPI-PUGE-AT-0042]